MPNRFEQFLRVFSVPLLFLISCAAPLCAQTPVTVAVAGIDTGKLLQTQDYSILMKGTVSAPGGLATMYTIDERGNRGEVAFNLLDAASGSYSFTAGTVALRPGLNRVTIVAADQSNAASSASISVISNQDSPGLLETRTGFWMGRKMTVQIKDGMVMSEGDMILGTVAEFEREQASSPGQSSSSKNP